MPGDGNRGRLSNLSRREFTIGAGAGALALGGAGAYLSTSSAQGTDRSYILQQGKLRWEIDPISYKDWTIEQFYGYDDTNTGSSSFPVDLVSKDAASRLFVYDGPVDDSLVFHHGSQTVDHGGTAFFKFSGLSRSKGEWVVRDDPVKNGDDDFAKWVNGNSKVKWQWNAGNTDGGAFWGSLDRDSLKVKITPKTLQGVDSWRVLSGSPGNLQRFELSPEKPALLRSTKGGKRSVKQANVDVMPGTEPNEFDPYSKEDLTVVVKQPPSGADASEWVTPADLDPGNYSLSFGPRSALATGGGAQPKKYFRKGGKLFLKFTAKSADFTLDSAYGYLVGKADSSTWVRGRDTVQPGGFDNTGEGRDTQLLVSDLHVDPSGADGSNLAAEYVEFENGGESKLDLTGYTIEDGQGWQFHLPDGFTLQPGERFRLHTGSGQWTDHDLYWGLDTPVWNNDSDTVIVLDAKGDTVLRYPYPRK